MAQIYTKLTGRESPGVETLYHRFALLLPDDYHLWHHLETDDESPRIDLLLLHPEFGLWVFKMCDWRVDQIKSLDAHHVSIEEDGRISRYPNPVYQALQNYFRIKHQLSRIEAFRQPTKYDPEALCLPLHHQAVFHAITEEEMIEKKLFRVFSPDHVITADLLEAAAEDYATLENLLLDKRTPGVHDSDQLISLDEDQVNLLLEALYPQNRQPLRYTPPRRTARRAKPVSPGSPVKKAVADPGDRKAPGARPVPRRPAPPPDPSREEPVHPDLQEATPPASAAAPTQPHQAGSGEEPAELIEEAAAGETPTSDTAQPPEGKTGFREAGAKDIIKPDFDEATAPRQAFAEETPEPETGPTGQDSAELPETVAGETASKEVEEEAQSSTPRTGAPVPSMSVPEEAHSRAAAEVDDPPEPTIESTPETPGKDPDEEPSLSVIEGADPETPGRSEETTDIPVSAPSEEDIPEPQIGEPHTGTPPEHDREDPLYPAERKEQPPQSTPWQEEHAAATPELHPGLSELHLRSLEIIINLNNRLLNRIWEREA